MKLSILSPQSRKEFEISWLEVNSSVGNFVMQRGHAPMVLVLAQDKSITMCLKSGKQESLFITGGVLEIMRDKATILIT